MGVNGWLLNKFRHINKERMNKHLDILSKTTGKSKLYIKIDMFLNFLTRGCGYTDYFRGNYIDLSSKEKDTFVTAKKFYKILEYLNDSNYIKYLNNKLLFNNMFKEYLKRDYIDLSKSNSSDLKKFVKDKKTVFAKQIDGEGGHGIKKISYKDVLDFDKLYDELVSNNQLLVEEEIKQCDEVNEINPNVVNSFRIITLYKDKKVYVIGNAFRINQDDSNVIGCTNDLYFSMNREGVIDSNVIDDYGNIYIEHPLTKKKFADVKIPGVDKAFDMCIEAHKKIPQVRYIGWDIAFSNKGPVMVEGNEYPGYGLVQFYKLKNKRTGHLKEIADVLGDEMKNIKI